MAYLNVDDYIGDLESIARRCEYDLDTSDANKIVLIPRRELMPTIYGYYQESDSYFWYSPEMEFPSIVDEDSLDGGSFGYYLDMWKSNAAYIADYMLENNWEK